MKNPWPLDQPALVDRADDRRDTAELASCDAVVVHSGRILSEDGRVVLLPPDAQPAAALRVYLGRAGERDLVALVPEDPAWPDVAEDVRADADWRMHGLRDLLAGFWARGREGERDHELATSAVAVTQWHANHPWCSTCGQATVPTRGGWVRHCDACGRDHYPRTDPAVICAVTDPADRLLLAHAALWSPRRFSHVAGYVEPGETFEQAVHRELYEEVGLRVHSLEYLGSQSWPFPASVMVAFRATTEDPTPRVDGVEITEARFVARADIAAVVASGEVVLPPPGSVARRMMEHWYGGPVPVASGRVFV